MKNLDEDTINNIYLLHKEGLTSRKIARNLNINHKTVNGYLSKKGLKGNGHTARSPKYINYNLIQCSKCNIITYTHNFLMMRPNKKYPYRLSYCNSCRRKQLLKNQNSDPLKVLRDCFLRLKLRTKKYNIPFDLDYDYFKTIYNIQQGICFYSNEKMDLIRGIGSNKKSLTTDKVIPELGYIKGNIVFCTKKYNTVKNDLSLLEIKEHMPSWYNKIINTEWLTFNKNI